MPSEVINVGKIMRQEAYLKNGKRGKTFHFKVSSKAVQEEISFLRAKIESDVYSACLMYYNDAKKKKKMDTMTKTVSGDVVIRVNGYVDLKDREEVD